MKNIILISIDALRADHLSAYGYDRQVTPNLQELFEDGLLFENAFSVSSHTRESVPSILTGKYPDEAIDSDYELSTEIVAERLPASYNTAGFHSNPFVSRVYGFSEGFDHFFDDLSLYQHKYLALLQRLYDKLRNRHYARGSEIESRAKSWISESDSPFFLWTHYMDVHGPYEPPSEYADKYGVEISDREAQKLYKKSVNEPEEITENETELLRNLYDAEIEYVDSIIGEFVSWLRQRDLYSDSVIILTSDHGDAFDEYGYYAHPSYKLDDILIRVPLLVTGGAIEPQRVTTPVSTLDIVPTILDITDSATTDLPGESLFEISDSPEEPDRIVFSQSSGSWKDSSKRTRIFAGNSAEGGFTVVRDFDSHEIVDKYGTVAESSELAKHVIDHSESRLDIGNERAEVDGKDEVNNRLEALGYK